MGYSPVATANVVTRDVSTPAPRFSEVGQIDNANCKARITLPETLGVAEVSELTLLAAFSAGGSNPFAGKTAPEALTIAAGMGVAPQVQAISNDDAGKSFSFGVPIPAETGALGQTLYLAAFIKDAS